MQDIINALNKKSFMCMCVLTYNKQYSKCFFTIYMLILRSHLLINLKISCWLSFVTFWLTFQMNSKNPKKEGPMDPKDMYGESSTSKSTKEVTKIIINEFFTNYYKINHTKSTFIYLFFYCCLIYKFMFELL